MLSIAELRQKWNDIPVFENGFIRIDESHPLEVNIGYEELDQKTLMVIDTNEIADLPSSRSIIAKNFQRTDGQWAISFRLVHKENEDEFIMLCWDMIEASRNASSSAVGQLLKRYRNWQKLLERQHNDVMNIASQKGLIGELLYLQQRIQKCGCAKAIESWVGPEAADQDFVFDDTWAEIKCVAISAESVAISSLEQLSNENIGMLVIFFIDKTSSENIQAFSLAAKVNEVRSLFMVCPESREKFELKLFQYGYRDLREYTVDKYIIGWMSTFLVDANFPKLTKTNIASQIVSAVYHISLAAIAPFKK